MKLKRLTIEELKTTSEEPCRVGATLPAGLHRILNAYCDAEGITVSEFVRAAITNFLVDVGADEDPSPGDSAGEAKVRTNKPLTRGK